MVTNSRRKSFMSRFMNVPHSLDLKRTHAIPIPAAGQTEKVRTWERRVLHLLPLKRWNKR